MVFCIPFCEGWYFTHKGKILVQSHHFTKRRSLGPKIASLTPPLSIEVHVPAQEVSGINFASFLHFFY